MQKKNQALNKHNEIRGKMIKLGQYLGPMTYYFICIDHAVNVIIYSGTKIDPLGIIFIISLSLNEKCISISMLTEKILFLAFVITRKEYIISIIRNCFTLVS